MIPALHEGKVRIRAQDFHRGWFAEQGMTSTYITTYLMHKSYIDGSNMEIE